MSNLTLRNNQVLSAEERVEFNHRCQSILEAVNDRNRATSRMVTHIDEILSKSLWREDFINEEQFIKSILNIEKSSCLKIIKANRMYLYLLERTEDEDEKITLSMMKEAAYRELRRIATNGQTVLREGSESLEDFQQRFEEKQALDFEAIHNLWKWVYEKIKRFKIESQSGLIPGGGVIVTASDITQASLVLQGLLAENTEDIKIELEGRDISIKEIEETSPQVIIPEVIDTLADLSVSEKLREDLQRSKEAMRNALMVTYNWDKIEGKLEVVNNRLVIINQFGTFDLINEWADLLGQRTTVSIKRPVRGL